MSDYEKAVEALQKAGFKQYLDDGWLRKSQPDDTDDVVCFDGDPLAAYVDITVALSDLPALLNPITPEKVEKAVRAELLNCEDCDGDYMGHRINEGEFVAAILARLKEE